jgi:hypothetical protein
MAVSLEKVAYFARQAPARKAAAEAKETGCENDIR